MPSSGNYNPYLCIHFHVTWYFSMLWINKLNPYKSGHHNDSITWIIRIIWISFLKQGNVTFYRLWSLEKLPGSDALNYILTYMLALSLPFMWGINKSLRVIGELFVLDFFQSLRVQVFPLIMTYEGCFLFSLDLLYSFMP